MMPFNNPFFQDNQQQQQQGQQQGRGFFRSVGGKPAFNIHAGVGPSFAAGAPISLPGAPGVGGGQGRFGNISPNFRTSTIGFAGGPQVTGTTRSSAINQFSTALFQDIANQQDAADQQFNRLDANNRAFEDLIGRSGELNDLGQLQNEALQGRAKGFDERAAQFEQGANQRASDFESQFNKKSDQISKDTKSNVDAANKKFDSAIDRFESVLSGFQDQTAQQSANAVRGIQANMKRAQQQIASGINPDGSLMTGPQRFQAQLTLERDTNDQVNQTVTQISTSFNEKFADLGSQLSQLKAAGAQQAFQGAGLISQTELGLQQGRTGARALGEQTRLNARQSGAQTRQFAEGMRQLGEQLQAAGLTASMNFEAQGRGQLADMIRNNPRGIISVFAGLSALANASATLGNQGAFDVPNIR